MFNIYEVTRLKRFLERHYGKMKRQKFDEESHIIGGDFSKVIDRYGGKGAGLLLLEGIGRKKSLFNYVFQLPRFHLVHTGYYEAIEPILRRNIKSADDLTDRKALLRKRSLKSILEKIAEKCAGAFPEEAGLSRNAFAPIIAPSFHLRSSTTIEDFKDDRYFGTFGTEAHESIFFGYGKHKIPQIIDSLLSLVTGFYARKWIYEDFEIPKDEKLGFVLMPSVESVQGGAKHITMFSISER